MYTPLKNAPQYMHEKWSWPKVTDQTWRSWRKIGRIPEPEQLTPGCKAYRTELLDELGTNSTVVGRIVISAAHTN